jgi:nucleoside phosphorylase
MVHMDEILVLSNEPLPETTSTITLEVFSSSSEGVTRRSGLLQKKELEGKITFNPERCLIYSLPPTGSPAPQVIAPDRTQWDLYLIIIPFTLHKPAEDRYYEEMTFFVTMADHRITAFDLFPKHITTTIEEAGAYTLSPQLTIGPVDASIKQGDRQIRFPSLHPIITAFGEGESTFYWVYEKSQAYKRVIPETKHALVVLQVPRHTMLVDLTISYEMVVARQMLGLWRFRDATTDEYEIQWDLSKAQPFYDSGNEQMPVEAGQRQKEDSLPENAYFDVCVICALAEEVRAFIQEALRVCGVQFERAFDKRLELEYYHTRILNTSGEPLTMQVSWLPAYGPLEAGLHLKPLLEKFRPRFAAMTGICAGDKRRVKLGDLIVADRAYFYDSGKFIIDEHGNQGQIYKADVYHVSPKIRRFIGMFEQWKSLIEPPEPASHIGAIASGNAVRGDNLFDKAQFPVRDTLAIDMEGAAFYRTVEDFPEMYALLVKGVSDYADGSKDDSFHERASVASAVYMLAFIQEYVTADRMART